MALISLQDITLSFGGPPLLEEVNLQIEPGQAIGLLGRNGMGKTTLLKLIHGDLSPESGEIARQAGLCIAYLPQDIPLGMKGSVRQVVASGLKTSLTAQSGSEAHCRVSSRSIRLSRACSSMQRHPSTCSLPD